MMHQVVRSYDALTQSPEISPVEHVEMLRLRDEVAALVEEGALSSQELGQLAKADRRLAEQAGVFAASLMELEDLGRRRLSERIGAERWWWYLDVLAHVPARSPSRAA